MPTPEYEKLLDNQKYQVFLVMSSAALPFITFRHPWIVINEKGLVSRYEIRHTLNKNPHLGHLYINAQKPFQGIPLLYYIDLFFQPTQLIKLIEGDDGSLAKRVVDFVKNSSETYPLIKKYSFIGPNCGTYVEWILDNFPEIAAKLPWTAIGKNYTWAK